ncbi:MAG: hypothetical protein O9340_03475 [Cyclobacteriaceae bacterium]|jgi:hypothetical protein|nr:hypothetical protein [Cyclobacteriaceae bacterium]
MKKQLLVLSLIALSVVTQAQVTPPSPPPTGGDPPPPIAPLEGIIFLAVGGLIIGIYYFIKKKSTKREHFDS